MHTGLSLANGEDRVFALTFYRDRWCLTALQGEDAEIDIGPISLNAEGARTADIMAMSGQLFVNDLFFGFGHFLKFHSAQKYNAWSHRLSPLYS